MTSQTSPAKSLRKNGRVFGIRLENALLERIKMKASRRGVTVAEYCRSVLLADVQAPVAPEVTNRDLFNLGFKALEDLQVLRAVVIPFISTLLLDEYNAIYRLKPTNEELAANPHAQAREVKRGVLAEQRYHQPAIANKRANALARLQEP